MKRFHTILRQFCTIFPTTYSEINKYNRQRLNKNDSLLKTIPQKYFQHIVDQQYISDELLIMSKIVISQGLALKTNFLQHIPPSTLVFCIYSFLQSQINKVGDQSPLLFLLRYFSQLQINKQYHLVQEKELFYIRSFLFWNNINFQRQNAKTLSSWTQFLLNKYNIKLQKNPSHINKIDDLADVLKWLPQRKNNLASQLQRQYYNLLTIFVKDIIASDLKEQQLRENIQKQTRIYIQAAIALNKIRMQLLVPFRCFSKQCHSQNHFRRMLLVLMYYFEFQLVNCVNFTAFRQYNLLFFTKHRAFLTKDTQKLFEKFCLQLSKTKVRQLDLYQDIMK